ncbi:MAG: IS607 family transposase, partial [Firmicutes bacterium]|nr:IS607 family transposase [Bacillota bacterium]
MKRKLVGIREAAELLGVTPSTLRRWEREGKLIPDERTVGGPHSVIARKTVAYARVSSHDQKDDLERQKQVLELYCARQGWTFEVVADLGSGMNYHKKGLKRLLNDILADRIGRLVITHKDRLLRFGAELVFAICEAKQVEVIMLNHGEDTRFEEELAQDVLEII